MTESGHICPVERPCLVCLRDGLAQLSSAPREHRIAGLQFYGRVLHTAIARAPTSPVNGEAVLLKAYREVLPEIRVKLAALGAAEDLRPLPVPAPQPRPPPPQQQQQPHENYVSDPFLSMIQSALVADLTWFFGDSESAMGLRSSFPALVAIIERGGARGIAAAYDPADDWLEAALRARPISRALRIVGPQVARVLVLGCSHAPPELAPLGRFALLALETPTAVLAWKASRTTRPLDGWIARLCTRLAARAGDDGQRARDRLLAADLRAEAFEIFDTALRAFRLALINPFRRQPAVP